MINDYGTKNYYHDNDSMDENSINNTTNSNTSNTNNKNNINNNRNTISYKNEDIVLKTITIIIS